MNHIGVVVALVTTPLNDGWVKGSEPPPAPVASSPSQRAEEPVRAIQVAKELPNLTVLVVSIKIEAVVEVAKVEGEDVEI